MADNVINLMNTVQQYNDQITCTHQRLIVEIHNTRREYTADRVSAVISLSGITPKTMYKYTGGGEIWDVSDCVYDISITTTLRVSPAKCEFTIIKSNGIEFWEGARVTIWINDKGHEVFSGTIMSKSRTQDVDLIRCVAYDDLRLLNTHRPWVVDSSKQMNANDLLQMLCQDAGVPYNSNDKPILTNKEPIVHIFKKESHIQAMQYVIDDILINSRGKKQLYMRMKPAGVTLVDCADKSNVCPYVIGDSSLLNKFKYTSSIEKGCYNMVTLYAEYGKSKNGKTSKMVAAYSPNQINMWQGRIQYFHQIHGEPSVETLEDMAKRMCDALSHVRRSIEMECISYPLLRAGNAIKVSVADLGDISYNRFMIVDRCVQKFSNQIWTMNIRANFVIGEDNQQIQNPNIQQSMTSGGGV